MVLSYSQFTLSTPTNQDINVIMAGKILILIMNKNAAPKPMIQIPENPNPKSGIVPGSCSFEEMLSAVADFKAPVFEPGGSMQQGMYTPKGELLLLLLPKCVIV